MLFDIHPKISNNLNSTKKKSQQTFGIDWSRIKLDFFRTSSKRISSQWRLINDNIDWLIYNEFLLINAQQHFHDGS